MARQLEKIEQAVIELCGQDDELRQDVKLLCSIPGISNHSAVRVLAYGKNVLRDLNRKALTAHAGLAPAQKQSGISIHGKSRIAKQGDRRLRTALFMPALVAAYHNPILKNFYQRLLKKGKPKMIAIVAVMKKLLLMIQAILKNKITFNPKYQLDR
jgi:transposase